MRAGPFVLAAAAVLGAAWAPDAAVPDVVFAEKAASSRIPFVLRNHATPEKHQVETMPGGVAVFDYDNDGWEDIYFVNDAQVPTLVKGGESDWNRLYRNNGDGTFADTTKASGTWGEGYSMAVAAADYDNDGFADIFVAGVNRNILYHNNGDGTFRDVTDAAGLGPGKQPKPWSISAGWFDYDNDGRLDLFVSNYCRWNPATEPYCGLPKPGYRTYCHPKHYDGLPNQLYRNNGDGTFTDVSAEAGIAAHIGKGMGLAFADYDGDGFTDVFVANDTTRNFLFHNDGGKKFTETGLRSGVGFNETGTASSSMGADLRDVDNDGLPDLFVTALSNETFTLFRNSGRGMFRDISYASRIGFISLPRGGWSTGVFDLNNDGWKDIFAAGSHVMDNEELYSSRTYRQANSLFVNTGGGKFVDGAGASPGVFTARAHRGCAFGDLNNDGRIDVVVSCLNEPAAVLINQSDPGRRWLDIRLRGTRSNRDGLGAKVRVVLPSGRTLHNHATTAVGYASSSSPRVHFGLGTETQAARVEILWPSGIRQVVENVPAGRLLNVTEPGEAAR